MTLSNVQAQLSSIQEQNVKRDETLKVLERDIKGMKDCTRRVNSAHNQEVTC